MKITIDTVNKTIEVNQSDSISEVIDFLKQLNLDPAEYRFVSNDNIVFIPHHTTPIKFYEPLWVLNDQFYFDHLYRPNMVTYSTTANHQTIN